MGTIEQRTEEQKMQIAYRDMICTKCHQTIAKGDDYTGSCVRPRHSYPGCPEPEATAGHTQRAEGKPYKSRRMMDFYAAKRAGLKCGKAFRATEDHPSTHGISPDLVGELVCYVYED